MRNYTDVTSEVSLYLPLMADSPVMEAGLFTVHQTSMPEGQLEQFLTFRVGRVLNMVTPPVLFAFGLPGNLMTLAVLTRSAFRSSSCGKYLVALALCDMLVLLLYFCFGFVDVFLYKLLTNDLACKLYYFSFFTGVHLSAWLLVAVTTQRCFVVCRPMTSRVVTSKRCTVCVIGGLTAASAALNVHHLVIREVVWSEDTKTSVCHVHGSSSVAFVRKVWPWLDATAYCFLPSLALLVLNVLIFRAMRKAANFRKSFQNPPQKGQVRCLPLAKNRVKAEDSRNSIAAPASAGSLSDADESASRLSRCTIAPRSADPVSPAWNRNGPASVSTLEDGCVGHDSERSEVWRNVSDGETSSSTHCSPNTCNTSEKVSESAAGSDCRVDQRGISPSRFVSESVDPEPDPAEIQCQGILPIHQPIIQGARSLLNGSNPPGIVCNRQTKKTHRIHDSNGSATQHVENNCSSISSNPPEDQASINNDTSDQTTKPRNRNRFLSFFSRTQKRYNLQENSYKLSDVSSETINVSNPSSSVTSESLRGREREPKGNQKQERESQSRQLTMMPLLASLVFLTFSAPLAVMLVAEKTIWIRNTAEQVAVYTLVRMVANTLMYLNHSVNFLLYCFAGSTFRRHCCSLLWAVCPCLCPCPCPCCPCCPSQFSSRPVPKSSNSSNF